MDHVEISTARLILRPTTKPEDYEEWINALTAENDSAFSAAVLAQNFRTSLWFEFRCLAGCWYLGELSRFAVIERSSNRFIGIVGPTQPYGWPTPEVGWFVAPYWRGRGYATEAATAAVDWVFNTRHCDEVAYYINSDNIASQNIARKLGSHNSGPGRFPTPLFPYGIQPECDIWIQTRDQWHSLHSRAQQT